MSVPDGLRSQSTLWVRAGIVIVALLGATIGCVAVALPFTQWTTDVGKPIEQWPPFSHLHHAGEIGLDCRNCHLGVETTAYAGLPPTQICLTCHAELYKTAPMLGAVRASAASGRPIEWKPVHQLPDYVYFNHSVHVTNGVGCSSCHGDVTKMALTARAEPMTMGWCLDCHRDPEAQLRPLASILDPAYRFPADQSVVGPLLARQYAIHADGLTQCSVCHR